MSNNFNPLSLNRLTGLRYTNRRFTIQKQKVFEQLSNHNQDHYDSQYTNYSQKLNARTINTPLKISSNENRIFIGQNHIEMHNSKRKTQWQENKKIKKSKSKLNKTMMIEIPNLKWKKQQENLKQKEFFQKYFTNQQILNNFNILSHIGKGCFSTVWLGIEKATSKSYAIKIYQKQILKHPNKFQSIRRQIKILKEMNHKNIIHLIHTIQHKNKFYLVMEYAGRHSLEALINKKPHYYFDQQQAKIYFYQILEAVSYIHSKNITHRDIKLANILISENNQIKLIDFGFSIMTKDKLSTFCGTPSYMAPEIVAKHNYQGQYVDIWACGVLLYVMLFGSYPFIGLNQIDLFNNIKVGKFKFKQDKFISQSAKRIISKMLKITPNQRCTAAQLLTDKWFLS